MAKKQKYKKCCDMQQPKKTQDRYNTIYCLECFEILSYDKPTKETLYVPTSEDLEKVKKIELDKVYNCDVFTLIEKLPNEYIDLVLTDPPYGDNSGYGRGNKEILNNEDYLINIRFLDAIVPKVKNNSSIYLFSNHKFFNEIKEHAIKIGLNYRALLILMKNNIGMGNPFRNQYEVCLVLEKGKPEYYSKDFSNVVKMKAIKHSDDSHPHTKQDDVIRKILKHSSQEGEVVFDGFMGSFATAKGCFRENRRFIGSEMSLEWHKKGVKELEALKNNKTMDFKEEVVEEDNFQGRLFDE